jgi:hypothetical protein
VTGADWQAVQPSGDLTLPEDELLTGDFVMLASSVWHGTTGYSSAPSCMQRPMARLPRLEQPGNHFY